MSAVVNRIAARRAAQPSSASRMSKDLEYFAAGIGHLDAAGRQLVHEAIADQT